VDNLVAAALKSADDHTSELVVIVNGQNAYVLQLLIAHHNTPNSIQ
jgi:hypothetical protein